MDKRADAKTRKAPNHDGWTGQAGQPSVGAPVAGFRTKRNWRINLLLKDYVTLSISLVALVVSVYNFYIQQLRKKVSLVGSMISVGIHNGDWDRKMEYVISNTGDVQIAVKEVEYLTDERILPTEVIGLPVVLKPGEIALIDVFYKNADVGENSTEIVEFGIFSARGRGYRLPHKHQENGKRDSNMWNAFELKDEHEGF